MYGIDKSRCDPYGLISALSFDMCAAATSGVFCLFLLLSVFLSWTRLGWVTGPVICPLVLWEGKKNIAGQSRNVGTLVLLLTEAVCILVNLQKCHHGVVL